MRTRFERKALLAVERIAGRGVAQGLSIVVLLIKRDLKLKYRNSVLGYLWSMMNPLLSMLVVSLVFSHIIKDIPHYHLYVLAGVLVWNTCTVSIVGGTHSLVGGGNLLRKVNMPAWIFPLTPVGMACVNFTLSLIPFLVLYFAAGEPPKWQWVLVPAVMALLMIFLLGLSLLLSTLNVFFRDVGHVLEPVLSLAFYGTPIIYDRQTSSFPPWVGQLLAFNPFTHFVEVFRGTLLPGREFHPWQFALCAAVALTMLAVGALSYKRGRNDILLEL